MFNTYRLSVVSDTREDVRELIAKAIQDAFISMSDEQIAKLMTASLKEFSDEQMFLKAA